MPKTYLDMDVLSAARRRIEVVFDNFEVICVSYSGGKDSTVLLELVRQEAERRGRQVHVLFIDLEAQYRLTIETVEKVMLEYSDRFIPWWICLPLNLRNAVSVFQPHWAAWDPSERDRWVRPMPTHDCVISDPDYFPFFRPRMEFEEFIVKFPEWLAQGRSYASLVAIRSDESLNRYKAVARKKGGKRSAWVAPDGTRIRWGTVQSQEEPIVAFYPIYDWGVEDVWKFIGESGVPYNPLYDRMYLAGVPLSEQRICQPYGDDQRKGLDLWARVEPETWPRVLDRVQGVNFGNIYAGQQMLGYRRGLGLPEGHTWKSYTFFLLSTLPEVMREKYLSNFAVFLEWYQRHGYPNLKDVPDESKTPISRKGSPSWQRLALAILKNDFWGKSLSIGMTKNVVADVYERVQNGEPVKVRRSVEPVYAYLREQYEAYCAGGVAAVSLDFARDVHPLKEKYRDL